MEQRSRGASRRAESPAGRSAGGGSSGARPPGLAPGAPLLNSRELFSAGDEVLLEHEGTFYRLRRTRNGRLILTK